MLRSREGHSNSMQDLVVKKKVWFHAEPLQDRSWNMSAFSKCHCKSRNDTLHLQEYTPRAHGDMYATLQKKPCTDAHVYVLVGRNRLHRVSCDRPMLDAKGRSNARKLPNMTNQCPVVQWKPTNDKHFGKAFTAFVHNSYANLLL